EAFTNPQLNTSAKFEAGIVSLVRRTEECICFILLGRSCSRVSVRTRTGAVQIAKSLDFFRMRSFPGPHVSSRFVEDPDVVIFGHLACQCRTDLLPQWVANLVTFLHRTPVSRGAPIAAV